MSGGRAAVRTLLAVSEVRGAVDALERVLGELEGTGVDAVAVVGDLGAEWESRPLTYRTIFKLLGVAGRPAFWVPGPLDAPLGDYLRESYNLEVVYPFLHGVHGAFAFGPGPTIFAGMGGEIRDDPSTVRVEEYVVRYPAWEAEYRLKVLRELPEHERVLLFATPPAHKGLRAPGSEALAELVKTHNPRAVVVAGPEPREERLGRSLVVCPGRLADGRYALVDLRTLEVERRTVGERAPA
ncbi:MAG TPA: hypothetical protein VNJ46_04510 [Gaiellaceae bacterium]|nr:hypothetical protein [Gaiellaceae bacterium]